MTPRQLRRRLKDLETDLPLHQQAVTLLGKAKSGRKTWYRTQKEHCMLWLRDYNGPAANGRKVGTVRDARFFWNHGQCPAMLIWLAEAVGVPESQIIAGLRAAQAVGPTRASQCGAFRKHVTWDDVERRLPVPEGLIGRLLG